MIDMIRKTGKFSAECKCGQCGNIYSVKSIYEARKSPIGHLCEPCKSIVSSIDEPDQTNLNAAFHYDPITGDLTFKTTSRSGTAGALATFAHSRGYLSVSIAGKQYLAHRIIFMMMEGYWPEHIDHINHNKADNRWANLREVQQEVNNRNMPKQTNSATGYIGVSFMKTKNKYRAYITVDSKAKHLGVFDTAEEAAAARELASIHYGYHTNHGK